MSLSSGTAETGGRRRSRAPVRPGRWVISIVYLVRHGETPWNSERRIQGGIDIPLNDRGRQQAEALAGRLAEIPLAKIYSSDLGRALETTAIIRARQCGEVPVVATPALRECSYGLWEGLTREEVVSRFPHEWAAWLKGGGIGLPPQGEDFPSLARRTGEVFAEAAREGEPVLISTHHGSVQAILCHALGLDLTLRGRFLVTNCSLSAIECLPGPFARLILLNDTSHLASLALASNRGTVLSSW